MGNYIFLIDIYYVSYLVNWWQMHGATAPDLKIMAIRILGLTTSSSGCERNWSVFEMVNKSKCSKQFF